SSVMSSGASVAPADIRLQVATEVTPPPNPAFIGAPDASTPEASVIDLKNAALDRLRAGQLAIGVGLRQARTVDIAKAMRTAGYDWLFIDMEHNSMDLDTAVQISVAAQDAGITP